MSLLHIVCIDDQRVILMALQKDLSDFKPVLTLWDCESALEAKEVMDEIFSRKENIALIICDHVMPKTNGIDFLIEINNDDRFEHTKKVLLTGMATQQDAIHAMKQAHIDRFVEKPWEGDELRSMVSELLTIYVIQKHLDYEPFMPYLHQITLQELLKKQ
ncbi:response regulator [candidate division KSB1 bacterium]|jgi:two-component system chemotaxis response regulator CheY|nr:response regulator [candidate division KSB1 bacterium]